MVRVMPVNPAAADDGDTPASAGTGFKIVNDEPPEAPPPGATFITVTEAVVAVATSAAVIAAVSWVELTKVVVRLLPFHLTTLLGTKFVPFTVRVKAAAPGVADVGLSEAIAGTGLLIVNVT